MDKVERALIAYAVLKTNLGNADLYEGLMAFFRPITASLAGQLFNPGEFSQELGTRYGLHVPPIVLASLAERMVNAKLLRKRVAMEGVASYEYANSDMVASSASLPKITEILVRFRSFAREQSAELRTLEDTALDDALFDRLVRIESLAILSRRDGLESPKQTATTITLTKKDEFVATIHPSEIHLDYVVPRFILSLLEQDSESFDLLCDIASANLAAETLLTYREPPRRGDALEELDIYLDAPLCLDILGVNHGREEYGNQLSKELKRTGCRVNVFLHSINEIERILDARKQSYLSGIRPFDHFQVDSPNVRDLVNALAGHSEQILTEQFGFNIVDSADAIPLSRRTSVGAEEEKAIRDQLVGWKNPEGRDADVATCCDLIRMRSGLEIQTRILKAGATLITRNAILTKAANSTWRNWLTEKNKGSRDRIKSAAPLAILDKQFAGLLWITQGGQVGGLGRTHLIANCSAAIATRKDVITRVYNTLIKTSEQSAQVFAALINDQRAERALMDSTFGDPDVVTDETVLPLLETVRLATAQEVEAAKNLEIQKLSHKLQQSQTEHSEAVSQLALERDNAEAKKILAENHAKELEQRERQRQEALIKNAFKKAQHVYVVTVVLIAILLGLVCYLIQKMLAINFEQLASHPALRSAAELVLPAITSAVSGLALAWDVPELIAGNFRNRIGDSAFKYFASVQGVNTLLNEYSWDFKTKSIEQRNPARNL